MITGAVPKDVESRFDREIRAIPLAVFPEESDYDTQKLGRRLKRRGKCHFLIPLNPGRFSGCEKVQKNHNLFCFDFCELKQNLIKSLITFSGMRFSLTVIMPESRTTGHGTSVRYPVASCV
jgi:hypothetical protein